MKLYAWHGWELRIMTEGGRQYLVIEYTAEIPAVGFKAVVPFNEHDAQFAYEQIKALVESGDDDE